MLPKQINEKYKSNQFYTSLLKRCENTGKMFELGEK